LFIRVIAQRQRLGPRKFAQKHNLDITAIVLKLDAKPTIRVETV
jgi:hypothetical protein